MVGTSCHCVPKWSNDGSRIAYITLTHGDSSAWYLMVCNKAGAKINKWFLKPNIEMSIKGITWSPDGNTIAILSRNKEILYVLLHEDFYKITIEGAEREFLFNNYNISNEVSQYFNNNSSLSTSPSPSIMVRKNEINENGQGFQRFISECENGLIYEYIEKELKEQCNIVVSDRKGLKRIVFTTMFTDNRFLGQPEAEPKRLFKKLFPDVYRVFAKLKKGDKKFLPILLQSIESKLMLDYITKRISQERPTMPIWTIHDSVVCPVGNEQYVAKVMKEETQKAIGMNPKVSFEYWTPDNLNSDNTLSRNQFSEPDVS